jgi:HAD superfamily hydrolase (TIGR01549 family)
MSKREISTILFDLDGTLLPMDQQRFMAAYLEVFSRKCQQLKLPVEQSLKALDVGFSAMKGNDGSATNERRFWEEFSRVLNLDVKDKIADFITFYTNEFKELKTVVGSTPLSEKIVSLLREKGYRLVLATTPVFPRQGTLERIAWANLEPKWFELITTYEDFSHTKPSLGYYQEILDRLDVEPQECLMIGNDVTEDLVVETMGMDVFLVTDHLINTSSLDITRYRRGSMEDLMTFCGSLASRN